MKLLVYARRNLITRLPDVDEPALLLEGSWPVEASTGSCWSLDEAIDGRFDWIDRLAAEWTERLAATGPMGDGSGSPPEAIR